MTTHASPRSVLSEAQGLVTDAVVQKAETVQHDLAARIAQLTNVLADESRRMAQSLETAAWAQPNGTGADLLHLLSRRAGDAAAVLDRQDPANLLSDVQGVVGRHPGAAMTLGALAGFAVVRLIRAGGPASA